MLRCVEVKVYFFDIRREEVVRNVIGIPAFIVIMAPFPVAVLLPTSECSSYFMFSYLSDDLRLATAVLF